MVSITETIENLIKDDTELEGSETFQLKITDSDSEYDDASSVITVTILDNDGKIPEHGDVASGRAIYSWIMCDTILGNQSEVEHVTFSVFSI